MKRFLNIITASAALLTTAACSDIDENFSGGTGFISLELSVDPAVETSANATRAGNDITAPAPEDFAITLADATGQSHTWSSLSEFPQNEQYQTGDYTLSATYGSLDNEGFESPCFAGSTNLTVTEASLTRATITATLANAMVSVNYTDAFRAYFKDWSAELHAAGGAYINFAKDETRPAFLRPGNISIALTLTLPSGAVTTFSPASINDAKARHHYHVNIDVNNGNVGDATLKITIDDTMDNREVSIDLSDDLIAAPAPEVTPVGFTLGSPVVLSEGSTPSSALAMDINARNGLAQVTLTTNSSALLALGWPAEIDLLAADAATQSLLTSLGLNTQGLWHNPDRMAVVDFTDVVSRLTIPSGSNSLANTFTIVVKDKLTKVNDPVTLKVDVEPVDLSVNAVSPAVMGINKATINVSAPSTALRQNISVQHHVNGQWVNLTITDITPGATPSTYNVIVNLPEGAESMEVRVLYCGIEKARVTIPRSAPEYEVSVDPFASRARVKISAREAAVTDLVTRYIKVFINNTQAPILERDPSTGLLTVLGLSPSTAYSMTTTTVDKPTAADYTSPVKFTTEGTPSIPNADFEEVKEAIKYDNLLSGGRFSQNTVEIFNRQNSISLKLSAPVKGWANTNAKTFCTSATNPNTWYMQPSVFTVNDAVSGGYGVELRSVAFDVDGADIPDYLQPGQPFTNYSLIVPPIKSRAAGKLFLGEYSFDPITMTEHYSEGIAFNARPLSLNGFYKFLPCSAFLSDRGMVKVEVSGSDGTREVTIATGTASLTLASTYTSFSVPLSYRRFGIKATRLKIMFASTEHAGTMAEELNSVVTVDHPESASSIGGSLFIDNLSLSY